ncbi:hypothetical protein [Nonomuraea jabiensis]|uniref:hypothetical protein n=1 Tax=Nonomuraea jabiensis TaxID=882448 RepID=UPI003D73FDF7
MSLKRLYVLFFVGHATCVVHVAGVMVHPTGAWVAQQARRNLVVNLGERAEGITFLIRDRDAKFIAVFDEVFTSLGARVIMTPVRAPRANAIAERWGGTVRRECTNRLLIYGENHLRRVLRTYERHDNTYWPDTAGWPARTSPSPNPLPIDQPVTVHGWIATAWHYVTGSAASSIMWGSRTQSSSALAVAMWDWGTAQVGERLIRVA